LGIEAVIVIGVLLGIVSLLAFTRISADAIMLSGLTALLAVPVPADGGWKLGVISGKDALAGFGNDGLATVAVLFMVVTGLKETGGIDFIAQKLLGRPKGVRSAIFRTMMPVWGMSVFLNNTPVVAMMIPAVQDWSKKLKISPSKLMIPLSYAAIIGGTCSLIGTSTNLVVAGLVIAQTDLAPLKMFDITWVGLPCALIGACYLIFIGPLLLPDRRSSTGVLSDPARVHHRVDRARREPARRQDGRTGRPAEPAGWLPGRDQPRRGHHRGGLAGAGASRRRPAVVRGRG
jgi:di/tricarboxylate transporter